MLLATDGQHLEHPKDFNLASSVKHVGNFCCFDCLSGVFFDQGADNFFKWDIVASQESSLTL